MKIERDLSLIRQKEPVILSEEKDEVAGLLIEDQVYLLSPNDLLNTVALYCHEVGHFLGQRFSYQRGLNVAEPEVLSFNRIKEERIVVELAVGQSSFLADHLEHPCDLAVDQTMLDIGDSLLTAFTMGKFSPDWVSVEPVSAVKLSQLLAENPSQTTHVCASGQKLAVNSRLGRNLELAATMTEAACLQILENTLRANYLLSSSRQIVMFKTGSPAHQRARNLVSRSHEKRSWRLPSDLDLSERGY